MNISFPRSEIIQNLSVFSSYLETFIQREEGNYRVSQQGQRIIRHILDQVLSGNDPPSVMPEMSDQELLVEDLLHDVDVHDRGLFLDWMDGAVEHKSDNWLWLISKFSFVHSLSSTLHERKYLVVSKVPVG
jgi:chromatin structure-remodeling complex subunit RSC3/30